MPNHGDHLACSRLQPSRQAAFVLPVTLYIILNVEARDQERGIRPLRPRPGVSAKEPNRRWRERQRSINDGVIGKILSHSNVVCDR
jgi:hypothetical protein